MTYNYPVNGDKIKRRVVSFNKFNEINQTDVELVISYLSTFTNTKCENVYKRLVKERITKGPNYGIEPVTREDIQERKNKQIQERIAKMRGKDIYKGIETHTDEEYLTRLRREDSKFISDYLTDEAIKKMKENREKQEKENEEDELMYKSMLEADRKREARRNMENQMQQDEEESR